MDEDMQVDELHDYLWVCPECGSGEVTETDDGWCCINCGWSGDEEELTEEEVPL